jgi:hypothetical protein
LLPGGRAQSRFSRISGVTQDDVPITRFVTNCFSASLDTDGLLCSVFDGTRTRFATIDPETARVTPVAWMEGQFTGGVMSPAGWLSGWTRSQAVALRPITREAIRLTPARGTERVTYLTATDRTFTTLSYHQNGSTVRVYAVDDDTRRASMDSNR